MPRNPKIRYTYTPYKDFVEEYYDGKASWKSVLNYILWGFLGIIFWSDFLNTKITITLEDGRRLYYYPESGVTEVDLDDLVKSEGFKRQMEASRKLFGKKEDTVITIQEKEDGR